MAIIAFLSTRGIVETPARAADRKIAATTSVDRSLHAALIESPRRLRFYLAQGPGKKAGWNPEFLDLAEDVLVPGAQLAIQVGDKTDPKLLRATTISNTGDIVIISGVRDSNMPGRVETFPLKNSSEKFPAGAGFVIVDHAGRRVMFAVSQSGKLLEIDLSNGQANAVESRSDAILPGGNVSVLESHTDEVFIVDRRGNLVSYVRDPVRIWNGPQLIGTGFRAGSDIVLWWRPDSEREVYAAAVNAKSELRLARHEKTGWRMEAAPGWVVPTGTPIAVNHTPVNIRMLGINSEGTLISMHMVNTEWRERRIARGYHYQSQVVFPSPSQFAFSVDAADNLMASTSSNDVWRTQFIPSDGGDDRGIVGERDFSTPSTTTAQFRFWNPSGSDVTLRLYDAQHPSSTQDHLLAAGKNLVFQLQFPVKRTLKTIFYQPASSQSAATEAEAIELELERIQEVVCDSPYEIELLKSGPSLRYQDERFHKYPRLKLTDPAKVSLGVFSLPRGIDLPPSTMIDVDAINSVENRRIMPYRP